MTTDLTVDHIQKLSSGEDVNRYQRSRITTQDPCGTLDGGQNISVVCSHIGLIINNVCPSLFRKTNRYTVHGIRNIHTLTPGSSAFDRELPCEKIRLSVVPLNDFAILLSPQLVP